MSRDLSDALRRLADAVSADHPRLGVGVGIAADLADDELRARVLARLRLQGQAVTQQAIDAALNGRRKE